MHRQTSPPKQEPKQQDQSKKGARKPDALLETLTATGNYIPAAARSAAARSVRSHEKSGSVRPK